MSSGNEKIDRRILRTKENIRAAFLSLASECGCGSISVSAVCEKANINRNTFYYHYSDINALFEEISSDFVGQMERVYRSPMPPAKRSTEICRIFADNPDIVRLLHGKKMNTQLMDRLVKRASSYVINDLKNANSNISSEDSAMIAAYIIRGTMAAVVSWFGTGKTKNPEEVGRMLAELMEHGTSAFT